MNFVTPGGLFDQGTLKLETKEASEADHHCARTRITRFYEGYVAFAVD